MPVCIHSGGVGQVEGTLRVCNPRPKIRVPSYHIWKLGGETEDTRFHEQRLQRRQLRSVQENLY